MGKLIIISGPSCVGKGPLVKTLEIYLATLGKSLVRHVLYNTRNCKKGEVHGETYWYSFLWDNKSGTWNKHATYDKSDAERKLKEIEQNAIANNERFECFNVIPDDQGINYSVLKRELQNNDIVILEIFQDKVAGVMKFCNDENFAVKRIFISPLSEDDYNFLGCSNDKNKRDLATTITMFNKLVTRGRDSKEDIEKRAKRSAGEVNIAKALLNEDEILVNHFGEGAKKWDELQERVSTIPQCYDFGKQNFSIKEEEKDEKEIDKTFRQFLEMIFPEIPNHVCTENLEGCVCKICGSNRQK